MPSVQMDLIPVAVEQNIVVTEDCAQQPHKSGDFTGGSVNMIFPII